MSLTEPPAATATTATSLTVDELEAKLNALHDYLSTPYRTRAETILQQRRRRERVAADLSPSTPLRITAQPTTEIERNTPAITALTASSSALPAEHSGVLSDADAKAVTHTVDSPARPPFIDIGSRAERATQLKEDTAPQENHEFLSGESYLRQINMDWATTSVAPPAAAANPRDEQEVALPTQRRIQRLEWQVQMLADALQHERDRNNRLQENVVRPLHALVEASVKRQVELEWELSTLKKDRRECSSA